MIHKNFINLCLTLLAVCWSVAVQAQTLSVDGIDYSLDKSSMTASVTGSKNYSGTHLIIPEKVVYNNEEYKVTSVSSYAFVNCLSLTSVDMPWVTSLADAAFCECTNLVSVNISSVTNLSYAVFWGCSSLASIKLPSSMTSIDEEAFSGCLGLTSVEIPSSVTSIGSYAFGVVFRAL